MLLKTHIFEKIKATSPVKKIFWPNSSRVIEYDKRQGTTLIRVHKVTSKLLWMFQDHFCRT